MKLFFGREGNGGAQGRVGESSFSRTDDAVHMCRRQIVLELWIMAFSKRGLDPARLSTRSREGKERGGGESIERANI